ncbi:MAG: 3-Deoxy-D-manno-octulosonic-acid transferase [Chlorobi bacterium OLB5]|nr:MAG: 3-Deoxy-D-manno-octulosonic-acid transferase [Chlorobi bacterium OLB5]
MKYFWTIVYNFLFLPVFWLGARLLSIFNNKLKAGFKARKDLFKYLNTKIHTLDAGKKNILIHCASLGEFEQAKPIIDELDKSEKYNFVITFFSPSGFNHSKIDTPLRSKIIKTYLPFDTPPAMKKFIDIINPSAVIFIKYDLWMNFLKELNVRNIYSIVINSAFDTRRFKWRFPVSLSYKKFIYQFVDAIGVTDEEDRLHFRRLMKGTNSEILVFGDTKYERISKAKEISQDKALINGNILTDKNVFVVGSSWDKDDDVIFPVIDKISSNGLSEELSLVTILAPHEPTEDTLEQIEYDIHEKFQHIKSIRYSELNKYHGENLIIIDCIGILMGLYKYADVAFVGGGYQTGMHNVLEPAGYGIPVLFGDEKLSEDAEHLIKNGGGNSSRGFTRAV